MSDEGPIERGRTIRDSLANALRTAWFSASQLSSVVSISEKAVPGHLEHLRKSAKGTGERFEIEPSVCLKCDYTFDHRDRLTRPSRCPQCRAERISPPRFRLLPA